MSDGRPLVPTRLPALRRLGLLATLALVLSCVAVVRPSYGADPVTITMARDADMLTFDPAATEDDPSIFVELQIFDRLVKLNASNNGVEPELATAWTVAPDGLSATFTLRQGIKFSDGSPLTADDVVFSLTRGIDPKGSWGFLFSPVKSVAKVDDKTIRLNMSEPFAPLLPALSTFAASIYSKANFEKWGKDAGQHPLGTGAFMLESWQKGAQLALVKNPNYWQPGKPKVDRIVFRVVGDGNSRVLLLQSGQVDIIDFVPPNQVQSLMAAGQKIQKVEGTAILRYTLNETVKPLDEANVRCAMAHTIDRAAVAKNIYFGQAVVARSLLPSSTLYHDPNADPVTFDIAKAKALLAKSSVPNGFTVSIHLPAGNQAYQDVAQIWAAGLKQIGITLKLELLEQTTLIQMRNAEKYIDLQRRLDQRHAGSRRTPRCRAGLLVSARGSYLLQQPEGEGAPPPAAPRARSEEAPGDRDRAPAHRQPGLPADLRRARAPNLRRPRRGSRASPRTRRESTASRT